MFNLADFAEGTDATVNICTVESIRALNYLCSENRLLADGPSLTGLLKELGLGVLATSVVDDDFFALLNAEQKQAYCDLCVAQSIYAEEDASSLALGSKLAAVLDAIEIHDTLVNSVLSIREAKLKGLCDDVCPATMGLACDRIYKAVKIANKYHL